MATARATSPWLLSWTCPSRVAQRPYCLPLELHLHASPLVDGKARLQLPGMTPGVHYIQARYSGDSTLNATRSNVVQQLVGATPGGPGQQPPAAGGLRPGCSLPPAIAVLHRSTSRPIQGVGRAGPQARPVDTPGAQRDAGGQRGDFKIKKPFITTPTDPSTATPATSVLLKLATTSPPALGFTGLNHADSRNANAGQNTSSEPPDQAIAVSEGQILEAVNNAVAVYSKNGTLMAGPTAANTFFGVASAIVRDADGKPVSFGPFVADPRALFDVDTGRWFVTALYVDIEPKSGLFLSTAAILIAVSETADATQPFRVYKIDITDAGYGKCPCLGDQPLLGVNADGIYISTNQFTLRDLEFQTALVLAIDKYKLAAGQPITAVGFQNLTVAGLPAFSVQPAIAAPNTVSSGVQFFMNSLNFNRTGDNRVAVWALTDTRKLQLGRTDLTIQARIVESPGYATPMPVEQRMGLTPLRDELNAAGAQEQLERLDTNDDRLQQVYLAGNTLHSALTTVLDVPGERRSGIAWLQVEVAADQCSFTANTVRKGYLALPGADLFFPGGS